MHMLFTEDELRWMDTSVLGWPIIKGCPQKIKDSILQKKKALNDQMNHRRQNVKR